MIDVLYHSARYFWIVLVSLPLALWDVATLGPEKKRIFQRQFFTVLLGGTFCGALIVWLCGVFARDKGDIWHSLAFFAAAWILVRSMKIIDRRWKLHWQGLSMLVWSLIIGLVAVAMS